VSTSNIVVDIAKKNNRTLFPPKNSKKIHILIILIVDYLLTPSVSMFIGQGLSLEARHAAQAERGAANTATAAASEAAAAVANSMAAAAADSTAAAAALTERASSASWPFFVLSPPAEMDSIAPRLVYAEEFYLGHNRSVCALLILCHGLTHNDGVLPISSARCPMATTMISTTALARNRSALLL
jgi:hypothetical protein